MALLIGGARKIGEAIAPSHAGAIANVMIADLNGENAKETAEKIASETGLEVLGMKCDGTDEVYIRDCVSRTVAALGDLSTSVNIVGWGGRQEDPASISEDGFLASCKLNTICAHQVSMACLPHLRNFENASITNSGSFSSSIPA